MDILALCPFSVGALLWEARPSQWSLTVCVKATFSLVPGGESVVAPKQDPICEDRRWDKDPEASLYAPDDLAPLKPRVDILLSGHAYAPGGIPVPSLVASLRVGDLSKSVRVTGDRVWLGGPGGLVPSPPVPFVKMPVRYERAAFSQQNPVGIDSVIPAEGKPAAANIEVDDRGVPGFGPIAPSWPSRGGLLTSAAQRWAQGVTSTSRVPAGAAPQGFDFRFFNAAPIDQQVDLLRSGVAIELENLHPTCPLLSTRLPPIRPQVFRVDERTGRVFEVALRCDTLFIDSDRGVATLSYRGLTDVRSGNKDTAGKVVVAADPKGKRISAERIEKALREDSKLDAEGEDEGKKNPLELRYDAVIPRHGIDPTRKLPMPPPSSPVGKPAADAAADLKAREAAAVASAVASAVAGAKADKEKEETKTAVKPPSAGGADAKKPGEKEETKTDVKPPEAAAPPAAKGEKEETKDVKPQGPTPAVKAPVASPSVKAPFVVPGPKSAIAGMGPKGTIPLPATKAAGAAPSAPASKSPLAPKAPAAPAAPAVNAAAPAPAPAAEPRVGSVGDETIRAPVEAFMGPATPFEAARGAASASPPRAEPAGAPPPDANVFLSEDDKDRTRALPMGSPLPEDALPFRQNQGKPLLFNVPSAPTRPAAPPIRETAPMPPEPGGSIGEQTIRERPDAAARPALPFDAQAAGPRAGGAKAAEPAAAREPSAPAPSVDGPHDTLQHAVVMTKPSTAPSPPVALPSVIVHPSIATAPPPPATVPPPAAVQPPAFVQPPAAVPPPAFVQPPPATVPPPATMPPPATASPSASVPPPAPVPPPAMTSPASVPPPAPVPPPATASPSPSVPPPAAVPPPALVQPPPAVQPPAPVKPSSEDAARPPASASEDTATAPAPQKPAAGQRPGVQVAKVAAAAPDGDSAARKEAIDKLTVDEYARIVVAIERGEVGKVLAALKLQLSDLMRIQLDWSKKTAGNPALNAAAKQAVQEARKKR